METRFPDSCAAKFRPVKPLASGGFGAVWEAVQLGLDRPAAIKIPSAHTLKSTEERVHFEREARLTAQLGNQHVVRVLDWGLDDGAWIAYELLPGPTLRAHVDASRPPLAEALAIVRQVALALDSAHRAGIIHRDIKPENVMAAGPGWWKVMDFGVARWLASSTRTQTGVILGTPLYVSPEQVRGERATAAADLYAVGVMLFEMLTGTVPHDAARPVDVLLKRLEEPAPRLADVLPGVPPRIDALVGRLLDRDPRVRPASAEELVRELDEALPGSTRALPATQPASEGPTVRVRTERPRSRAAGPSRPRGETSPAKRPGSRVLAGAAAVLTAALLFAGFLLRDRSAPAGVVRASADAVVRGAPSPTVAAAQDVPSLAGLLRDMAAELRVFPGVAGPRRCALAVPHASPDVTLELAGGWKLAGVDGRAAEGAGTVRVGPLSAGLHWVEVTGSGASPVARVRGLADGPPAAADPRLAEMERLHHELIRLAHSRQSWEDEVKLPGHGADGSPLALAQAALMLRQTSEVPDAFTLLSDPTGKVRLAFEFDVDQVRTRTHTLLVQVERAFAGGAGRWDAWHALGWLLANADQRSMGRLAFARALALWPASPWSWVELSRLERRELRVLEDAGMPRALLRETNERAQRAWRQADRHGRAIVAAPGMKACKLEFETLGLRVREDTARLR